MDLATNKRSHIWNKLSTQQI